MSLRSALRWPLRVLLGLLALVLVLVLVTVAYVQTPSGNARLLRLGLRLGHDALAGGLEVGSLRLQGGHLLLRDVTLKTPEGERVAHIDEVELQISLGAMLRRTLRVEELRLQHPEVWLVQDERGLNAARAVAPRNVSPPSPPGPPLSLTFRLDALRIERGDVRMTVGEGEARRRIRLDDLGLSASGMYVGPTGAFQGTVESKGALVEPLGGPFQLTGSASGAGDKLEGHVDARLAGLIVTASAHQEETGSTVRLERLHLPSALAKALLPEWPLRVPVELRGEGHLEGKGAQLKLQGGAGKAQLVADLDGQLDTRQLRRGHLALTRVDLAELLGKGPPTSLALTADASGGGTSLQTLTGKLDLVVPASRVRNTAVGPVELHATASRGAFELRQLTAQLPGLSVEGRGKGTVQRIAVSLDAEAKDLSALGKTFDGLLEAALPPLAGTGQLHLEATGPIRHPGVGIQGQFRSLRVADFRARHLRLAAHADDTDRLLDSNVQITADALRLGERRMKNASVEWLTRGQALELHLGMEGSIEVQLDVGGTLDPDRRGLEIETLTLRYPEVLWNLEHPTHLRIGENPALEQLRLLSDGQSISLAGWKRGTRFDATVAIASLDLSRLPASVVTGAPKLGGTVSLDAHASGTEKDPWLEATVDAREIQVGKVQHASLQGHGSWVGHRAVAKLTGKGLGTELTADVDLPVDALQQRRHVPLHAQVTVPSFDVGQMLCAAVKTGLMRRGCDADGKPEVAGHAELHVDLSGHADAPVLKATVKTQGLTYKELPPTDLALEVDAPERGHLAASLEGNTLGGTVDVKASLGHTLAQILSAPRPVEVLRAAPLSAQIRIAALQLAPLHTLGLIEREVAGTVDLRGDLAGTVAAPTGELHLIGHQLQTPPMQPTDLTVDVRGSDTVVIDIRAQDATGQLVQLQATVGASPRTLQQRTRYDDVPLQLHGTLGPVDLSRLPVRVGGEGRLARKVHGTAQATIEGSGTLQAPVLSLHATTTDLAAADVPLGKGDVQLDYRATKTTVVVTLESRKAGTLSVNGGMTLDLSYPAFRRGLAVQQAPFDLTLSSKGFDLAFFTGFTTVVRELGGTLELEAKVGGTVGSPHGQGTVEWKDGRLWLAGYGQYRAIHLALEASNDRVALRDFEAHTDTGSLKLTASGERQGARWALKAAGEVASFPIFVEDQLVATASLRVDLTGSGNGEGILLQPIRIPEAHFELPAQSRKSLQPLDRPDDIILTRNGVPLDPKKARLVLDRDPGLASSLGALPPLPNKKPFAVVLVFDAPRNLWLKSPDLNLEVGLGQDFRVEISDPTTIFGEVKVIRGRLDVLGRRFDIQRNSSVRFTGPPAEPALDVTAIYTNVREGVKVSMHVQGQGKSISLVPSSEPPLSESEIYTLLATGRTSLKRNGGSTEIGSAQAVSVLGSLAASQLKGAVTNKVGLDVFSVEAGDSGGLQGATLEAGKYLTDELYLGYTGKVGADPTRYENANAVRLEYQFLPRWSFEALYGDAKSGSADIIWSRDY